MHRLLYVGAILVLFLASCGRDRQLLQNQVTNPQPTPTDPTRPVPTSQAYLSLFAMANCQPCKIELPTLHGKIADLSAALQGRIHATLYVIGGYHGEGHVDQATAQQFANELGLTNFEVVADSYGEKYYSKYFVGLGVPAAVVLQQDGTIAHKYNPGSVDVDDMMSVVQNILSH